jgi:drug/metabolite transporter (DMT)-like permease
MLRFVVFLLSVAGAVFLGAGWVLQQRVAVRSGDGGLMSWKVLLDLIRSGRWWLGIAGMTIGQSLAAWALQLGPVSAVEPVLAGFLLVAFTVAGGFNHRPPTWQEIAGPITLCAALAVFLAVADPQADNSAQPGWVATTVTTLAAAGLAAVLALAGRTVGVRIAPLVESLLFGAAAGLMYGLQDVATRGAIVGTNDHSVLALAKTPWPWVVLGAATAGVLLSQAAFRADRLDYALPPTAATQPVTGVVIGVVLLGDRLSSNAGDLAVEAVCLVAMVIGMIIIGLSPGFE